MRAKEFINENIGKFKFLRPGELKGSYTDAQLQALGFKKSQTGSWVIAQDKWKQLVQNKLISETETINEKRKKIKQKSKTRRIAYGGWIYGYPAASGESGEGGGDGGGVEESLNQPYNLIDWDQVDFGQPITTWAALPDGTYLEIEFNQESPAFNDWEVSFHRDDTMNLTGQGDAYRIFATVLFAIRKFVIDQNPDEISFSAFKNKDETGSRQSLYTALAKRYATSLGYTFSTKEDAYHQHYIFRKIRQKNKIQEAIEYQRHLKLINAHMKKMGYQKLGGGADAQVYAKTEDQVIKILIPSDATNVSTAEIAFVEFYKFCQANQRNPHLPKFFKIQGQDYTDFYIDGERFIQIAQERLTEIPAPSKYDDMLFDMINSVENDAPLERSYPGYELLYKTLQSVSKLGKILGFDSDFIKTDDDFNIMLRGQTLVITDPWVNFKLTENGSKENEEQMDQDDFDQQDPGQPIPFPKGTTSVDVSDPYDWYKLGMIISDLDDANPKAFGTGAPSTVIAFGSEQEEHKFLPYLKKLGLKIHDIDKPEDTQKVVPAKALIKHLEENFADGRNPQDKGDSKRYNVPTKGKISTLRKIAKQGGRRGQLAHWMANMRSGKQKAKK
jgi:hypothetical protein